MFKLSVSLSCRESYDADSVAGFDFVAPLADAVSARDAVKAHNFGVSFNVALDDYLAALRVDAHSAVNSLDAARANLTLGRAKGEPQWGAAGSPSNTWGVLGLHLANTQLPRFNPLRGCHSFHTAMHHMNLESLITLKTLKSLKQNRLPSHLRLQYV